MASPATFSRRAITASSVTPSATGVTAPTSITSPATTNKKKAFALSDVERLYYEIHRYSSYCPNYLPENVLVDCPNDQTSRWSAHTNSPPQYLILKLKRPAIVRKIIFGKFEKSHVCNLKKFRIYGGLEDEHMMLLLDGGLKNDNTPEVFTLRCVSEDGLESMPILYLKIVPLLSWGPSFNFSIWYIEMHGQDDPMYTSTLMRNYNKLREVEIIKLCLKHFRQQGYTAAFNALQEQTKVHLEHSHITELHKLLVVDGNFEKAEEFVGESIENGMIDDFLNKHDYKHTWEYQQPVSSNKPGNRGGHQLIVDLKKKRIYLYGGWDGFHDLSDLWYFDIVENTWTLLFEHSHQSNGPTPRSCHKMVFDTVTENIFMIGRYLDNSIRTTEYAKSDFYLFDTRARTWMQICDDTSHVGGPQLVYDHQMCIDTLKRTIYIFGGKVLTPRPVTATPSNEPEYSGLYSYHIATNTWTQILVDCHHPSASKIDVMSIKSRITHCMVFHTKHRKLYIYGGQRGKEDMDDFLAYDVDTQALSVLNKEHLVNCNIDARFEPSPGFTLRATIDCERDEIYVFSSLSKLKDRRDSSSVYTSNSFWVYSLHTFKWSRIYHCRHNVQDSRSIHRDNILGASKTDTLIEPCPRYAHQLVYDSGSKTHYLFGGNPGILQLPQLRLDDFWTLKMEKPKRIEILNQCRYLIRKLHYEEMASEEPLRAMAYLRNHIAAVIDHNNKEQLRNFHKLASLLFKPDGDNDVVTTSVPLGNPLDGDTFNEYDEAAKVCTCHKGNDSNPNAANTTTPAENLSIESCESNTTSGISESPSTSSGKQDQDEASTSAKRARRDRNYEIKNRRAYLFNKLVQLMPSNMVQPNRNLSDFVVL